MGLENTYVKIEEMAMNVYCNIYGVVVDWLECRESRGSDFVMTLDLIDESTRTRLSVKVFSRKKIFAQGFCIGDVVRIGCVKLYDADRAITDHRNDIEIMHNSSSPAAAVDARTQELVDFFEARKNEFARERLVSELESHQYFDFCGELVDRQIERNNLVILRLVDYSANGNVRSAMQGMYPASMVLMVKAWGLFAQTAAECEVGKLYKIKNLKMDAIADTLVASLSESRKGSIVAIARNSPAGQSLEGRKRRYEEDQIDRTVPNPPDRMHKHLLVQIKDLAPGVHRIQMQILQHAPFEAAEFVRCRKCDAVKKGAGELSCGCSEPDAECIRALKLLVCDRSGQAVVVCRNRLVGIAGTSPETVLNGVVLSVQNGDRTTHHLVDVE